MPYAYQCCVYGACKTTFKPASQWDAEETGSEDEDVPKRTMGMFPSHADNNCKQREALNLLRNIHPGPVYNDRLTVPLYPDRCSALRRQTGEVNKELVSLHISPCVSH